MGKIQADGATLRHHLKIIWDKKGVMPQQLQDAPGLPPLAAHVWRWFVGLCNERGNNGMSVSRITSENIKSWMWFNGVDSIELWERKAIAAMDDVWMQKYAEDSKK